MSSKKNDAKGQVVDVNDASVPSLFSGVDLNTILEENMKDINVSLPVIKISREGLYTSSNEVVMGKEIVGIVFSRSSKMNAYWAESYSKKPNQPPTCHSVNGITPQDSPDKQSSSCKNCRHNQYGTARNEDGSLGEGKACKNMEVLFVIPYVQDLNIMDLGTPYKLRLPPTSLGVWDKYVADLRAKNLPFQAIWTKFSLTPYTSRSGQKSQRLVLSDLADNGKIAFVANTNEDMVKYMAYLRDTYVPTWEEIMRGTPDQEIKDAMGGDQSDSDPAQNDIPNPDNIEDEEVPFD